MQLSGTSFAAPVVAGAAAQILARHPDFTPDQVKGALMLSTKPVENAPPLSVGVGELQAARAPSIGNPPNPNKALDKFVTSDPLTGEKAFDAVSWLQTAKASVSWDAVSYDAASWEGRLVGSRGLGRGLLRRCLVRRRLLPRRLLRRRVVPRRLLRGRRRGRHRRRRRIQPGQHAARCDCRRSRAFPLRRTCSTLPRSRPAFLPHSSDAHRGRSRPAPVSLLWGIFDPLPIKGDVTPSRAS